MSQIPLAAYTTTQNTSTTIQRNQFSSNLRAIKKLAITLSVTVNAFTKTNDAGSGKSEGSRLSKLPTSIVNVTVPKAVTIPTEIAPFLDSLLIGFELTVNARLQ